MSDGRDLEAYYNKRWRNPLGGSREPYGDEQLRAQAMLHFIEKYVVPSFGSGQSLRILDLGCGRGWFTNILRGYGQVIGIDPVRATIIRAHELFPDLDFRLGTAEDLLSSGSSGQFQLIVSGEVIEHVLDAQKENFMKSIQSLLVPGGYVILTTPRGELWETWKRTYSEKQPLEEWISEFDLEQLCRSVGFRIVAKDRVFVPTVSYSWLSRIATSKICRFLMAYFPLSIIFTKLRYYCGIYQAILLQRLQGLSKRGSTANKAC